MSRYDNPQKDAFVSVMTEEEKKLEFLTTKQFQKIWKRAAPDCNHRAPTWIRNYQRYGHRKFLGYLPKWGAPKGTRFRVFSYLYHNPARFAGPGPKYIKDDRRWVQCTEREFFRRKMRYTKMISVIHRMIVFFGLETTNDAGVTVRRLETIFKRMYEGRKNKPLFLESWLCRRYGRKLTEYTFMFDVEKFLKDNPIPARFISLKKRILAGIEEKSRINELKRRGKILLQRERDAESSRG